PQHGGGVWRAAPPRPPRSGRPPVSPRLAGSLASPSPGTHCPKGGIRGLPGRVRRSPLACPRTLAAPSHGPWRVPPAGGAHAHRWRGPYGSAPLEGAAGRRTRLPALADPARGASNRTLYWAGLRLFGLHPAAQPRAWHHRVRAGGLAAHDAPLDLHP